MKELLRFDSMITPKIITFVYWLFLFCSILGGVFMMIGGSVLQGILVAVFGALFSRIWCELLIVGFKMNETLQKIHQKQTGNTSDI